MNKCPHCKKSFSTAVIGEVKVSAPMGRKTFNAVSYNCPNFGCGLSLGVEIDPIALKHDIVQEVIAGLRGH